MIESTKTHDESKNYQDDSLSGGRGTTGSVCQGGPKSWLRPCIGYFIFPFKSKQREISDFYVLKEDYNLGKITIIPIQKRRQG